MGTALDFGVVAERAVAGMLLAVAIAFTSNAGALLGEIWRGAIPACRKAGPKPPTHSASIISPA